MSSHAPSSHGHSGSGFFSTAKSWFASAPTTQRNVLSSADAIGHELTDATIKTTTGYIANILSPLGAVGKNALAVLSPSEYRSHGWSTLPRGVAGVFTNTAKSFANVFTGIPHAAHHAVQHGVNNTVVEASNGTLDRIPLVGKFLGNIPKLATGAFNAPFTFASWLMKKVPDHLFDWVNKAGLHQAPERHLTGSHASSSGGGHGHH